MKSIYDPGQTPPGGIATELSRPVSGHWVRFPSAREPEEKCLPFAQHIKDIIHGIAVTVSIQKVAELT